MIAKNPNKTLIYGLLLVGGLSKRMGRDKFDLVYRGEKQYQRALELLKKHTSKTFISLGREQKNNRMNEQGYPVILDQFEEKTPLNGIVSAFLFNPRVAWLVLACDIPLLTSKTLSDLIEARNEVGYKKKATCYVNPFNPKGKIVEPLCAIYESSFFPEIRSFFNAGKHCPRKMIEQADHEAILLKDQEVLYNTNYFEDYKWAKNKL